MNSASLMIVGMGGKTPVAWNTASIAVVTRAVASSPAKTAPALRRRRRAPMEVATGIS
jgi:hypothetical protein